jgi:hypothetical protein
VRSGKAAGGGTLVAMASWSDEDVEVTPIHLIMHMYTPCSTYAYLYTMSHLPLPIPHQYHHHHSPSHLTR